MFTVTANPIAPVSGSGDSTTFEVTFAPTTAGAKTAILHIASNDADENPFDINLSGIGVPVTPRQMFDSWAATANLAGANAEPFATPHHDGVINLLKYAFSMSGNAPDVEVLAPGVGTVGLPSITLDRSGAPALLRFEYLRRKNSGLSYFPRKSPDLANWLPLTATPVVQAIPSDPEWERVIVAEPVNSATEPQCFGRVVT
jgi:hypothetical protein